MKNGVSSVPIASSGSMTIADSKPAVAEPDNFAVTDAPRHHVSSCKILCGRLLLLRPFAKVFRMPDLNLRGIVASLGRRCVLGFTRRYAEEQGISIFGPLRRHVRRHAHVLGESGVFAEIVTGTGGTRRRDSFPGQDGVAFVVEAGILFTAAVDDDIVALLSPAQVRVQHVTRVEASG